MGGGVACSLRHGPSSAYKHGPPQVAPFYKVPKWATAPRTVRLAVSAATDKQEPPTLSQLALTPSRTDGDDQKVKARAAVESRPCRSRISEGLNWRLETIG